MKRTSELGQEVFNRLMEIGLRDITPQFEKELRRWLSGRSLLVVVRGPDECECCGKPQIKAAFTKKTKRPLEELFAK